MFHKHLTVPTIAVIVVVAMTSSQAIAQIIKLPSVEDIKAEAARAEQNVKAEAARAEKQVSDALAHAEKQAKEEAARFDQARLELQRAIIGKMAWEAYFITKADVVLRNKGRASVRISPDDPRYTVLKKHLPELKLAEVQVVFEAYVPFDAPGITFENRVYIKRDNNKDDRGTTALLAHELTHALQIQRMGDEIAFAKRYVGESVVAALGNIGRGYNIHDSLNIEREANDVEAAVNKALSLASAKDSSLPTGEIVIENNYDGGFTIHLRHADAPADRFGSWKIDARDKQMRLVHQGAKLVIGGDWEIEIEFDNHVESPRRVVAKVGTHHDGVWKITASDIYDGPQGNKTK